MAKTLPLRALTRSEQRTLTAKLKDLSLSARVHQRYRVIDEVQKGRAITEAADRVGCHFTVAYDWVHRFNDSGFATFEQVANPKGRPPILKSEQLRELVEVALSSPEERGLPFSNWSVPKLAEYCRAKNLLPPVTAYFSDRGRWFQRDRGRRFTVIVDGRGCAQATGFIVTQSSMMV